MTCLIRRLSYKLLIFIPLLLALPLWGTPADSLSGKHANDRFRKGFSPLSLSELMEKGRKYYSEYHPDSAMACFSLAAARLDPSMTANEKEICVTAMVGIGCVFRFFAYDYERAYHYFFQALKVCNEYRLDRAKAVTCLNLGTLLDDPVRRDSRTERSESAKQMYAEAIKYAVKAHSYDMLAMALINMTGYGGEADLEMFRVLEDEAIPDTVPGIRFCRLMHQGLKALEDGRYEQARSCFERQLEAVNVQLNPELLTLAALMNIAETYYRSGNHGLALQKLDEALSVAERFHTEDHILLLKRKKGEVYAAAGDTTHSRKWHLDYLMHRDSLFSTRRLPSVEELNLAYKALQNQEKVEMMNVRNTYQRRIIIICVLLASVMIAFAIMMKMKNRKLHSLNRSLYDRNSELMQMQDDISAILRTYDKLSNQKGQGEKAMNGRKYNRSSLSEEEKYRLYTAIDRIMNDAGIICKHDFTLSQLVQLVESNPSYVSQVINEKYHVTFSILLGNYRIKEACRRMQGENAVTRIHTMEALSDSLGFKSRSTFVNAFKRVVGVTPSEYLSINRHKAE